MTKHVDADQRGILDVGMLLSAVHHDHNYCTGSSREAVNINEMEVHEQPVNLQDTGFGVEDTVTVTSSASSTTEENISKEISKEKQKDIIIADLRTQLKNKDRIINRLQKKVRSLKEVIGKLRKKNLIDKRCGDLIMKKFSGPSREIFQRILKGKKFEK